MTDKETTPPTTPSATVEPKPLHLVYSVTNIQNKIRTLDGSKTTYSMWVKLFKLHVVGYDVLNHIDGTEGPDESDESYDCWRKIDVIVLQWIYGTLSNDLLTRVLETDSTAQEAWNKMIFLNNKQARAATLEHAFTNTTLASCSSTDDYFQKLKDIAEQLNDVGHKVSESRLVLYMVSGLPPEHDTVASFINQTAASWDDARDMIDRGKRQQVARQQVQAPHSAFTAPRFPGPGTTPPPSHHPSQQFQQYQPRQYNRGRGRGRNTRGGRGRGRYNQQGYQGYQQNSWNNSYGQQQSHGSGYSQQPFNDNNGNQWWSSPPPCPHPSQSSWVSQWNKPTIAAPPPAQNGSAQPMFAGYGSTAQQPPPPPFNMPAPFPPPKNANLDIKSCLHD